MSYWLNYLIIGILLCFVQNINAQSSSYNESRSAAETSVDRLNTALTDLKNNLTVALRDVHNRWQNAQRGNASVVETYVKYLENCSKRNNIDIPPSYFIPINTCVSPAAGNFISNVTGAAVNISIDSSIYTASKTLTFCKGRSSETAGIYCFRVITSRSPTRTDRVSRRSTAIYKRGSNAVYKLQTAISPCVTKTNATLTRNLKRINIDPSKC